MKLTNKAYDVLKWICLTVLPAISVFYTVVDSVFGIGYTDIVCPLIAGVCTLIGTLIGVSTVNYNRL